MGPPPEVPEAHALQGSLDGQVGTLIKALTLLDCLWTELEVGVWLWTQWAQPPEAGLSDVRPPEGFEAEWPPSLHWVSPEEGEAN